MEQQPIWKAEENDLRLSIYYDPHTESPRECDNLATMVCFHKRYGLGDKHAYSHKDYGSWAEMRDAIVGDIKVGSLILPLYLYDHSGITISTTPFGCPWDSGQIGWVFMSLATIKKAFGEGEEALEKARACILSEVEIYDTYLRGEAYYFVLEQVTHCKACRAERLETLDSCGGFLGDPQESMRDALGKHAYLLDQLS